MSDDAKTNVSAAIIYLVRSKREDVEDLISSLVLLKKNFLCRYDYPVIAFVEGDFRAEWKPTIEAKTGVTLRFEEVEFDVPEHIPKDEVLEKYKGFSLGYRHMCHFFTIRIFDEPCLQDIKWYWRLDTDSFILSPIDYDLFQHMEDCGAVYGHINCLNEVKELPSVVVDLWETTCDFAEREQIEPEWCNDIVDGTGAWNYGLYYTNFEITQVAWWRSKEVRSYLDFIDRHGGIYKHRWGDAPIHTLALHLFSGKRELLWDVHYRHQNVEIQFAPEEAQNVSRISEKGETNDDAIAIFISIPKNASHTISELLGLGVKVDISAPNSMIISDNHATANVLRKRYPEKFIGVWKFAFVRNPYSRVLSWYRYHRFVVKIPPYTLWDFRDWVWRGMPHHVVEQNGTKFTERGLSPLRQSDYVVPADVDFVGKIESFEADVKHVIENLNAILASNCEQDKQFEFGSFKLNSSRLADGAKDGYDQETRDLVYAMIKSDFDNFGYEK